MHFTNILAVASLAVLPALAAPGSKDLFARGQPQCDPDMTYNGFYKTCQVGSSGRPLSRSPNASPSGRRER